VNMNLENVTLKQEQEKLKTVADFDTTDIAPQCIFSKDAYKV